MNVNTNPHTPDVLKAFLDDRGLTQGELAEALGVDPKTVSRWMTGGSTLTLRKLRRVFKQLRVAPEDYGLEPVIRAPAEPDDLTTAPAWFIDYAAQQQAAFEQQTTALEAIAKLQRQILDRLPQGS